MTTRDPIEAALAEVGMMVRRARVRTLTETEAREIERRIRIVLDEAGLDRAGTMRALLDALIGAFDSRTATFQLVEAVGDSLRKRLLVTRNACRTVPNFEVLPHGVHGRRRPALTVFDGGRGQTPNQPQGAHPNG